MSRLIIDFHSVYEQTTVSYDFYQTYFEKETRECWFRFLFPSFLLYHLIAPLSHLPMFYIKYLTMHKVHMHAGAIRQLLYGCAYEREIIHSLKLVDYLPIHTHKPENKLHLL